VGRDRRNKDMILAAVEINIFITGNLDPYTRGSGNM
jgi:hypothetical protein